MGPAPGVPTAVPGRPGNALTVPRTRSMIDCPISRPVRDGLLFTSIPPMMAKPRTRIRGDPGTRGTLRSLQVPAPHEREAHELHVEPLGDDDLDPAPEGHRGDDDLGPVDLGVAEVHVTPAHHGDRGGRPLSLQRPLACDPLMTATNQRRERRRVASSGRHGQGGEIGHGAGDVVAGARPQRHPHPLGELVEGEAPHHDVLAEQGDGVVPIGVRHPFGPGAPAVTGSRRAGRSGSIQSVMDAVCSPAWRHAWPWWTRVATGRA